MLGPLKKINFCLLYYRLVFSTSFSLVILSLLDLTISNHILIAIALVTLKNDKDEVIIRILFSSQFYLLKNMHAEYTSCESIDD